MKKMICLALCMFLMAGCAGTNTGTGTSGDPLTEEDFAIYEEGKCIATVEEIMEANESGMRSFVYSWDGEELFPGRILETKRGVRINSTLRELAESYSGLRMFYLVPENVTGGESVFEEILIDDFLERVSDYETKEYTLFFNRWARDGKFMDDHELNKDKKQVEEGTKMVDLDGVNFYLSFQMKNNIVKDIHISRWDF